MPRDEAGVRIEEADDTEQPGPRASAAKRSPRPGAGRTRGASARTVPFRANAASEEPPAGSDDGAQAEPTPQATEGGRERTAASHPGRPCCLVSELLEEAGIDRQTARLLRRQVLEGIVLLCQWQLDRMDRNEPAPGRRPRRVPVD